MHLVIGDIHGCYDPFVFLLGAAKFRPGRDTLWLTGDLVNRGPRSADVMRHVMDLGDGVKTVLGNHDLHLLAVAAGVAKPRKSDNSHRILDLPDGPEMIDWLGSRPLALYCERHKFLLVHAAVHKDWAVSDVLARASEIEQALAGAGRTTYLRKMYGARPAQWNDSLTGWERLRLITNILTRARYFDAEGNLDLKQKGPPGSQPADLYPWYEVPGRVTAPDTVIFGHWSALGYNCSHNSICMDSGYLWGGKLTALRLKGKKSKIFQIAHE